MNEKTDKLRDIFLSVADEETVTERQDADRGSLATTRPDVDERLETVLSEMREEFSFRTDLDVETYTQVVRLFYDGCDDDEIAAVLSIPIRDAFHARMDAHLVHEDELEGVDEETIERVREGYAAGTAPAEIASEVSCDRATVEHVWTVVETRNRTRRVSNRYRTAFEEILTDADLTVQFTADAHEDGLEDATEDAEVDVDF